MADTSPLPTIERGAAVGADVEVLGVPLDGLHNLSRAGAAVHTGAPDVDSVQLKIREIRWLVTSSTQSPPQK